MSLNRFLLGLAASVLLSLPAGADAPAAMNSPAVNSPAVISPLMSATRPHAPSVVKIANKSSAGLETYRDLIQKAQNLTLQRDRLQTSQILLRGLQRETKGSVAYRELARALNELTTVFYTEKAQTYFVSGESLMMAHPHDATAPLQEALKLEEGNVAVLRALARAHLMASECARAETYIANAEAMNPLSAEVRLLRWQYLKCSKNEAGLSAALAVVESTPAGGSGAAVVQATPNTAASGGVSSFLNLDVDYEEIMPFARGLVVEDWLRRHDLKRARAVVSAWENQAPDYPELFYWKWQISRQGSSVGDRAWALKYVRACQELSPRKRKADLLDVELCKAKDVAEADLKALEPQSAPVAKGVKADD